MPTEDNHCAQCNKIGALPDSPTKMYMALDHLLDLGHQARPVEALETRIPCTYCGGPHPFNDCDDAKLVAQYNQPEPAKPPAKGHQFVWCNGLWDTAHTTVCGNLERHEPHWHDPVKPPESEALKKAREMRAAWTDAPRSSWNELIELIEADARRLKQLEKAIEYRADDYNTLIIERDQLRERAEKAEWERDEANALVREYIEESDAAEVRAHKAETELAAVKGRLHNLLVAVYNELPALRVFHDQLAERLQGACAKAEAGESMQEAFDETYRRKEQYFKDLIIACNQRDEALADRAKWIKVCAERDESIIKLRKERDDLSAFLNLPYVEQQRAVAHRRELVQRIKDYAGQHTQYPFADAIIDLCNQVLEPK